MSGLEVTIQDWRICLPEPWASLNEQTFTFIKSDPERGQFQISTARHTGGPKPAWDAPELRAMLLKMAGKCGHPPPRNVQECQTRQITVVCGDVDSNGTYVGRMWFASCEIGCLFATYFSPVGSNPDIDAEIAEAHQALLGARVVMQ
jgi:hypothetical protein